MPATIVAKEDISLSNTVKYLCSWEVNILLSSVCMPAQLCLTLWPNGLLGAIIHRIFQTGILGWVQFSSVTQSCLTLCDPVNCSTPGLPVHHQLLELTQTHVDWVGDAIQPAHPLSSPSLAFNLSQHQGLFKWVSSSHQMAKVLELQLPYQSLNTQDWSPLEWTGWMSLQSKGLSRVFSNTTVQKYQFFCAQLSL